MKKLLLLTALTFTVALANAQSFMLMNMSGHSCYKDIIVPGCHEFVCYNPEVLETISKEMYDAGNDYYIFVDLLKDGLMQENEVYNFNLYTNMNGDGELVPLELQKKYLTKWEAFVSKHSGQKKDNYLYLMVILKPGEIVNPQSSFRQLNKYSLWQHGFRQKEEKYILQEIITDGLGSGDEEYSYELSGDVLRINNRTVLKPLRDKYFQLYKDLLGMDVAGGRGYSMHGDGTINKILLKE